MINFELSNYVAKPMLVVFKKSTKVRNNKINQMKNNKISVFKDLFKSTDVPFNLTLEEIVARIKNGTSKEKVELIRKGNKEVKKKLPSIIFSGEFTERNRKGLKKHSKYSYPNERKKR